MSHYFAISIKFESGTDTYERVIKNPVYIPNIGESVHNEKDISTYYTVTKKEVYYSGDDHTHVIMTAKKHNT
jgi:hypothetical protein